jgi:7-carboxy-7-deazaguanine synthase
MYNLMEMFYSVQGEGSRMGAPSVFVRSSLCNFSCPGFKVQYEDPNTGEKKYGCDSYYAVDTAFKKEWESVVEYDDLVDRIDNTMPAFSKHSLTKPDIVFTGGEPLIYWKDDVFQKTLAHYISRGHKVTIETNASLDIEFEREYQKEIMFSCSVKLEVSGEPSEKRININTLTKIFESSKNSYLKFVTSKETWEEDYKEIKHILKELPVYAEVYLMPLGDTAEDISTQDEFVINKSAELGFMYSDRIHIRVWDNKPGV